MRVSKGAFEFAAFVLLNSHHLVGAVPAPAFHPLQARGGTPPPDHVDDGLPAGQAQDIIAWTDDDYTSECYKTCPDYDPDQDQDFTSKKRSVDLLFNKRAAPPEKGTTQWLRSVGSNGDEVRAAFVASSNQNYLGTTPLKSLNRDSQISMIEATDPIPVPVPKPQGYKSWQADHVLDLGIFTTIAAQELPDGIDEDTWQTVKDAILGEDDDTITVPQPNTIELGNEVNDPSNIRGIPFMLNQFKNALMTWAYGTDDQKSSYKAWNRSNVWGLYRYMVQTESQFNEVRDKACQVIQGFIMDEDQGLKVAEYYKSEIDDIYARTTAELERVLTDPPADNDKDSIFKKEDCKNTKDSPDTAPDDSTSPNSVSIASTPAPTPVSTPVSTPVASPTVTPVIPPNTATPSCVPVPTGSVKDSHESELQRASTFFCAGYAASTVPGPTVNIAETVISGDVDESHEVIDIARLYTGTENEDDVYNFAVSSIPECSTNPPGFNLGTPVPNFACTDLMYDAWKNCNNQGRGGSIVAACLMYSVSTKY